MSDNFNDVNHSMVDAKWFKMAMSTLAVNVDIETSIFVNNDIDISLQQTTMNGHKYHPYLHTGANELVTFDCSF